MFIIRIAVGPEEVEVEETVAKLRLVEGVAFFVDEDGLMVEVEVEMNRTELELLLEIEELIEDGIEVDLDESVSI